MPTALRAAQPLDDEPADWRPQIARIRREQAIELVGCRACGATVDERCRGRRGPRRAVHADRLADGILAMGRVLR